MSRCSYRRLPWDPAPTLRLVGEWLCLSICAVAGPFSPEADLWQSVSGMEPPRQLRGHCRRPKHVPEPLGCPNQSKGIIFPLPQEDTSFKNLDRMMRSCTVCHWVFAAELWRLFDAVASPLVTLETNALLQENYTSNLLSEFCWQTEFQDWSRGKGFKASNSSINLRIKFCIFVFLFIF